MDQIQHQAHRDRNPVIGVFESLVRYIQEFEAALDETQVVGARLVSFGREITFHVKQISYSKPFMIVFDGELDNGSKVRLLQHVSQLSVLLMALDITKEEQKQPIGFIRPD